MSPVHSQLCEGLDKTLQKDDDTEWDLVVAAGRRSAQATNQRGIRWRVVRIAFLFILRKRARVSWLGKNES